jgi:hypothetical protein
MKTVNISLNLSVSHAGLAARPSAVAAASPSIARARACAPMSLGGLVGAACGTRTSVDPVGVALQMRVADAD